MLYPELLLLSFEKPIQFVREHCFTSEIVFDVISAKHDFPWLVRSLIRYRLIGSLMIDRIVSFVCDVILVRI